MSRYYDEKCLQCNDCHFHGFGAFPDGTPYEACRSAGYILHLDKGISDEPCNAFLTEEQWQKKQPENKEPIQKPKKR